MPTVPPSHVQLEGLGIRRGRLSNGRALVHGQLSGQLDGDALECAAKEQLAGWFGESVRDWKHLRTVRVHHALPTQTPGNRPIQSNRDGVYLCGDHCNRASLQGAMVSGREAADAVMRDARA